MILDSKLYKASFALRTCYSINFLVLNRTRTSALGRDDFIEFVRPRVAVAFMTGVVSESFTVAKKMNIYIVRPRLLSFITYFKTLL